MSFSFLLFSYISYQIFVPFIATFIITNGMLILGQVIPLFEVIMEVGVSFPDLVRLIAYMTPKMLLFPFPWQVCLE